MENDAPALSTLKKWAAEFKRGRDRFEDGPRTGRPSIATIQENIDRIHQMVTDGRRLTVNYIANGMNVLHKELGMSKVWAR